MRGANHIALVKLKLEGFDIRHVPRKRGYQHDARWVIFNQDNRPVFAFRSPSEAWANLEEGGFNASYLVWAT